MMLSRALAIAVVAAACGSHPPRVDEPAPGAGSDPIAHTGEGGLSPDLVATVGDRKLVIEPVASLRLTAAEQLVAQQRIAAWAHASGLTILPPATVEAAIGRAAAGLDANTGNACGPPIERSYAMDRWIKPMGAEGKITARVDCAAECTMQLEIEMFGRGTEFYSAPFDPSQPWRAELERRLPQVIDNGGHERFGHANNPIAIPGAAHKPGAGDWYLDSDVNPIAITDADRQACGMADRLVALMLVRDPNGAVRCEPATMPGLITEYSAKVNACMCALAVKTEHPTTERSYVQYAAVIAPAASVKTRNGKDVSASLIGGNEDRPEGTAPWFLRDNESIAHCFTARTEDIETEIAGTLELDPNGAVAKTIIGDPNGVLSADERACIVKKLVTIQSPCPTEGAAQHGEVRITLAIHKPYDAK
jgi:hypothetical protein